MSTPLFLAILRESRTRFSNQLINLTDADLVKKLPKTPNSVGFLIRHIADVELLFAKNVFGASDLKVSAKTVIEKKDSGEWTNLQELQEYCNSSFKALESIIEQQTEQDWSVTITTKEFGTKTKAEAFGRIVSHTAYHAGQMAMIAKYGTHSSASS
jgi:uncharacterized damage-inducible protein DinB